MGFGAVLVCDFRLVCITANTHGSGTQFTVHVLQTQYPLIQIVFALRYTRASAYDFLGAWGDKAIPGIELISGKTVFIHLR